MSSEAPESQPTDLKGSPADLAEMREPVSDQTPPPDHQQQAAALSDEAVTAFLTERPQFVQQWLRQRGGSALGAVAPPVVLRSRNSITDDLFRDLLEQRRGSPTPVTSSVTPSSAALDENELMIELIRDIANEFDIHLLCRKIMKNVGVLTHADRGSLFLAKGSRGHRYLVANVFDVMGDEEGAGNMQLKAAGEIRIPFGLGIAGYVAQTKEIVNLADAYLDPHFSPEVDEMTGYKTGSLLCMPICNHADEVIGVAQIINKQGAECSAFTEADVQIFQKYLVFCGIGLQNAQLFDLSISEFKKNQILLNLARGIFVEQYSLENLVKKIMREATDLLHCEQAVVFLRDDHHDSTATGSEFGLPPVRSSDQLSSSLPVTRTTSRESGTTEQAATFVQCFSLTTDSGGEQNVRSLPEVEFRQLPLHDVALRVLETGETIATSDGDEDGETVGIRWHHDDRSSKMRSVLTIPIHNQSHTIIGVAHFINKENGYCFTDQDIRAVETFGVFCGLGIHNSQMYENACRLMAKQRVALECLSYHATASAESTAELVSRHVPSALQLNLYSHQFDDMELDNKDTCTAAIRMFKDMNMIKKFRIPYEVLCRWILSVQKNYRPVKYHNWRHALNVTQTMFALLRTGKMAGFISDQEVLGLMVACLSHDLDHRGTNNAFQSKTDSPLAMLYSTSTMEHHHFDQCVMILNSEGNNIFQVLKPEDYRQVMDTVQQAILSTDLEQYFKTKPQFLQVVRNGQPDWHEPHNKKLLMGMLMTACDVSAISKPWEIQHRVAKQVADEFFYQGDLERTKLNAQPSAMMDRERRDELPKMQMEFINLICIPLYLGLSEAFPWMRPMYEGCLQNLKHWQELSDQVDMGLTWIDRDSIEEPVETSRDISVNRITLHGKITDSPASKPERTLSVKVQKPSRSSGNVSPQSHNSTTMSMASSDRRSSAPSGQQPTALGRHRRFGRSCRRQEQETRLCAIS